MTTEVAETTSAEEQVASETVSTFDGNLSEGWMEKYGVAEDLRSDLTLKSTKHIGALASQLVNAQKMVGKNTTSIPTVDSPQTEWDAFHDNFRPATAADYETNHAEGVGEIDEAAEMGFKEFAHAEGLRPSTVQKLTDMYDARITGMKEAMDKAEEQENIDCETALKKQWGSAFDERKHLANRMISENVSEENKAALLEQVGNNPLVADFLANIANKFVEHKIIAADVTQKTPADALAEAEALRNTPGYVDGELSKTSPARYKQITQEITALMEAAYPEEK